MLPTQNSYSPPKKKLRRTISDQQTGDLSQNILKTFVSPLTCDHHIQNLEDCIVIWLDANTEKKSKLFKQIKKNIRLIVNFLKLFHDLDECITYITGVKDEKIFFITSGTYGRKILPIIHDLSNIKSIYIFCFDQHKHTLWSQQFVKVRGVFVQRESLLVQLTKDISDYINRIPITIIQDSTTQDLRNEKGKSMWFHILLHVLLRLPDSPTAKTDMINECLNHYMDNRVEQQRIEEFRDHYKCDDAIRWYTRDCFVYRLINKALRTENIHRIFFYRFFIIDLFKQLKHLHDAQFPNRQTLTLYRGQNMHATELEKIQNNLNGYLSVNTFLSTTSSLIVASDFSGNLAIHADPTLRSIIFEIKVDSTINKGKPFASIKDTSINRDEDEYLLTMGTIFQILAVEQVTDEIWSVTLEMVGEEHEPLKHILDDYKAVVGEESSVLLLGDILANELDDCKNARHYYEMLIRELSEDDINVGYAYSRMAVILIGEGNYQEAQSLFKKARKIYSNSSAEETPYYLAEFFIDLAVLRRKQNNLNASLKFQKKALKIRKKFYEEKNIALANTYKAIGSTYHELDKFLIAIKYYQKSDRINQQILPKNHPIMASTWRSLGDVYNDQGNYNDAKHFYEKALHALHESMPVGDVHVAECYFSLGTLYLNLNENQIALDNLKKGLAIVLKVRSENDKALIQPYTHIGTAYKKLRYPNTAAKYYLQALDIIDHQSQPYVNDLLETYCHLLYLYFDQENYSKTITYCKKVLRLRNSCENKAMNFFAQAYDMLGHVYCIQKRGKLGLKYCRRGLNIRRTIYQENHPSIADSYHNMALACAELKEFDLRLDYALKALAIRLNLSTDFRDDGEIIDAYFEISNAHISLGNYLPAVQALVNAQQYTKNSEHMANNYFNMANIYFDHIENYETAKDYYEKALHSYKDASLENLYSEAYWAVGKSYQSMGDQTSAIQQYRIALRFTNVADNSKYILAKIHHSIAICYGQTEQYSKALKNLHKAISNAVHYEYFLEELYHDLALINEKMKLFDQAMKYHKKVIRIHTNHLNECEKPDCVAESCIQMGILASQVFKKDKQLIKYTKQALSIYEHVDDITIEDKRNLFVAHNNLGDTYMRLEEHKIALEHLKTARNLASEIGIHAEHPQVMEIQSQISTIREQALA